MENTKIPVPVPVSNADEQVEKQTTFVEDIHEKKPINIEDITADDINNEIMSQNEDGYTPCTIVAMMEKLHNVSETDDFDLIADEDREIVDTRTIQYCSADMYSFDGNILNIVLKFDTPQDGYLKDLMDMYDEYKKLAVNYVDNKDSIIPMFSVTFLPEKYEGKAGATFSFPLTCFRVLDGDDKETCAHLLFNYDNADYETYDIDDNTMAELEADVLREIDEINRDVNNDENTGGRKLFE